MEMPMRLEIPDFCLLTEVMPGKASLRGRVVIFHFPTHTVLELVRSGNPLLESISPRYEWDRVNKYGEIDKLTFIVHRYVTDELTADRKSTRLNSSHVKISYAVFCLKKKISRAYLAHDATKMH